MSFIDWLSFYFGREEILKHINKYEKSDLKFLSRNLSGTPERVFEILKNLPLCRNKNKIIEYSKKSKFSLEEILYPLSFVDQFEVSIETVFNYYSKIIKLDNESFDSLDILKLNDSSLLDYVYQYFSQEKYINQDECDKSLNIMKKFLLERGIDEFHYLMKNVDSLSDFITSTDLFFNLPCLDDALELYDKINPKGGLNGRHDYQFLIKFKESSILEMVLNNDVGCNEGLILESYMNKYNINKIAALKLYNLKESEEITNFIGNRIENDTFRIVIMKDLIRWGGLEETDNLLNIFTFQDLNSLDINYYGWLRYFSKKVFEVKNKTLFYSNTLMNSMFPYSEIRANYILSMTKNSKPANNFKIIYNLG